MKVISLFLLVFVLSISRLMAASAPYFMGTKYQSVLLQSKLQAPTSRQFIANGNFAVESAYNIYFQIPDYETDLRFSISGNKMRSELRQVNEWFTSDSVANVMRGEILIDNPLIEYVDQLTFMQIHDSTDFNKPLLRLVWIRDRKGVLDHLWAVVKGDLQTSGTYYYEDMGARSEVFEKFEVCVQNSVLSVKRENIEQILNVNAQDVSHWNTLSSYFKAGVYLQDEGTATVRFRTLDFFY